MKIASVKGVVARGMMVALAAGALALASPAKAEAQGIAVGVQFGNPYYARRDGYEFARRQEFLRREAFFRHQEWERTRRFDRPYGYR